MNTFTKTEVFLSVFVQKRSSVNGALIINDETNTSAKSLNFFDTQMVKMKEHKCAFECAKSALVYLDPGILVKPKQKIIFILHKCAFYMVVSSNFVLVIFITDILSPQI